MGRVYWTLVQYNYFSPSCSFVAAATCFGSELNFLWSSLSDADAPNGFMPMTWPDVPT
jgi:hypothetical protein